MKIEKASPTDKYLVFDFDGTIADVFSLGIKRADVPIWHLPRTVRFLQNELHEHISELTMFPGIREAIVNLKDSGYRIGILTSNSKENVEKFLKLNDFEIFEFMYTGIDMFGKKRKINKMLKDHNMSTDQILYVGDEVRDIKGAHDAGVKVVSVSWGFNSHDYLAKENPDLLIDDAGELKRVRELL